MRDKFWLAIFALAMVAFWMLRSIAHAQYLPDLPVAESDPRDAARARRLSSLYKCPPPGLVTVARPVVAAPIVQPVERGYYQTDNGSAMSYSYVTRPGRRANREAVRQTVVGTGPAAANGYPMLPPAGLSGYQPNNAGIAVPTYTPNNYRVPYSDRPQQTASPSADSPGGVRAEPSQLETLPNEPLVPSRMPDLIPPPLEPGATEF